MTQHKWAIIASIETESYYTTCVIGPFSRREVAEEWARKRRGKPEGKMVGSAGFNIVPCFQPTYDSLTRAQEAWEARNDPAGSL